MKKILVISTLCFLAGCASKATTPLPTQDLNATGTGSTQEESIENAKGEAKAFCKRWNAAPAIGTKQTKYKGKLLDEKSNSVLNTATNVANALGAWVPSLNGEPYETSITYKCL